MSIHSNNLLNEIKYFSKSKFNSVYTKAFSKHIILPSHNPKKDSFCVAYCDFNRLNDINTIYSDKTGDDILSNSYSKIEYIFSQHFKKSDFSISLLGGDEFLILIDSLDRERILSCFDEITSIFASSSITSLEKKYSDRELKNHIPDFVDFAYGITFSDEKDFSSIYEMLYDAEVKQSHSKIFLGTSNTDFYSSLIAYSDNCISNFFKNYRFNNYLNFDILANKEANKKDIRDLLLLYINSLITLIKDPEEIDNLISKLNNIEPTIFDTVLPLFPEHQCREIYSYIQNNSTACTDYFVDFNNEDLYSFLNVLIKEPISGCYNKIYFQKCFTEFFKSSASSFSTAILVDTTNMKDSNLKFGHSATDKKIRLFSNRLQNTFENVTNIPFFKNNFDINADSNFIFDFGGGDYFILCKDFITSESISDILSTSIKNCEPLSFVYSSDNIQGIQELSSIVKKLYKKCEQKKLFLKNASLDLSNPDIINTFEMFLAPTLKFYIDNNPSFSDINEIKRFSNIVANSIIKHTTKYISYFDYLKDDCCKEPFSS